MKIGHYDNQQEKKFQQVPLEIIVWTVHMLALSRSLASERSAMTAPIYLTTERFSNSITGSIIPGFCVQFPPGTPSAWSVYFLFVLWSCECALRWSSAADCTHIVHLGSLLTSLLKLFYCSCLTALQMSYALKLLCKSSRPTSVIKKVRYMISRQFGTIAFCSFLKCISRHYPNVP